MFGNEKRKELENRLSEIQRRLDSSEKEKADLQQQLKTAKDK